MQRGNDVYFLNVTGEAGNEFQVIVRMSVFNKLNFSVILGVKVPPPKKFFDLNATMVITIYIPTQLKIKK